MLLLHLGHPPSLQLTVPHGVPLYPVDTIYLSVSTIIAPTHHFIQFALIAAVIAILMKYQSQVGLIISISLKFQESKDFLNSSIVSKLLLNFYQTRGQCSLSIESSFSLKTSSSCKNVSKSISSLYFS